MASLLNNAHTSTGAEHSYNPASASDDTGPEPISSSTAPPAPIAAQSSPFVGTGTRAGERDVANPTPVAVYDVVNDDPTDETPVSFQVDSPIVMLWRDFWILVKNRRTLPLILSPLPSIGVDATAGGLMEQIGLVFVSILITILCLVSFFVGFPMPVVAVGVLSGWILLVNLVQPKDRVTWQTIPGDDKFEREAWLFVNGIGTSRVGLQLILNALYNLFGRKVIGIENRTFGIWFDLVECMLQRDLTWQTTDIRMGYNIIASHIADPNKDRVVLMAHSQGGIIMSAWVDQLLADFSSDQLNKVEIYTFASAANHFSIPSTVEGGPAFGRVEHFVNTKDYVSCIGLLAFAPVCPPVTPDDPTIHKVNGRFAGRIFKRINHTGHLLLTHYLKEGDSILDDPTVRAHSKLASYIQ
ncbi:hypothetical protein I316_03105 [Kwoniella heveanensis BCC8398]|uniref:DUF676 domain-containing protein n=1 Tax=Kwoniella heveanensis BCC8398 TaxID=1296120 RepID=A0A1B9GVX6_9TREE|nr:hypothetical protein I316_03105 [Kwoniella heveanensis BCC8398]